MKKLLAILAVLAMCIGMFAGCTPSEPVETESTTTVAAEDNGLENARKYLYTMYKDKNEVTIADYDVIGKVLVGTTSYPVEWSVNVTAGIAEDIKIVTDGDKVTVDLNEMTKEEMTYELIATISDAEGKTEKVSFVHKVPAAIVIDAGMSYEEIVDSAYALAEGTSLPDTYRLFGEIVKIDTPYSEDYKNITVTIQVGALADKPIMCYRLAGEGADKLAVGDKITVEGIFKNYKGTIEFDAGCKLLGMGEIVDQSALVDAAYALAEGIAMTSATAMTGEIVKIDTPYSEDYKNITVTIVVDGLTDKPIMCYRLKGEGADKLAVGDKIGVVGIIKNYKGTIEFDAGCQLIDPAALADVKVAAAAYALAEGIAMTSESTMTGVITAIDTPYSADYKNITVTIVAGGASDYAIMCYRLAGEGADTLAVGDTITVTGTFNNYKGTIEFDAGCKLGAVVKAQ